MFAGDGNEIVPVDDTPTRFSATSEYAVWSKGTSNISKKNVRLRVDKCPFSSPELMKSVLTTLLGSEVVTFHVEGGDNQGLVSVVLDIKPQPQYPSGIHMISRLISRVSIVHDPRKDGEKAVLVDKVIEPS